MATKREVLVTPQEMQRWLTNYMVCVENHEYVDSSEMAAFVWTNLVTQVVKLRTEAKLVFTGVCVQVCPLEIVKEIVEEFQSLYAKPKEPLDLDALTDYMVKNINTILWRASKASKSK